MFENLKRKKARLIEGTNSLPFEIIFEKSENHSQRPDYETVPLSRVSSVASPSGSRYVANFPCSSTILNKINLLLDLHYTARCKLLVSQPASGFCGFWRAVSQSMGGKLATEQHSHRSMKSLKGHCSHADSGWTLGTEEERKKLS